MSARPSLSAVLITRDEAQRLPRCLEALRWADEIIVFDAGSTDDTVEVARRMGARTLTHPFDDFAAQRNRAADAARSDWILMVDADEEVSPELRDEIRATLADGPLSDAFAIPRRNILLGAWLRHGGQWPDLQVRLYRRGAGRFTGAVHERLQVQGSVGRLRAPLVHHSTASIAEYMLKLRRYTALEAPSGSGAAPGVMAFVVRPAVVFLRSYVWRRGFLDGYRGFMVSGLAGFYTFVTLARWHERNGER